MRRLFALFSRQILNLYYGPLALFTILAIVFICFANAADHEGHFWFHLSVELAVAFAMIVVTVLMVERMLEYRREQDRHAQWTEVRNYTVTVLWSSMVQVSGFAFSLFIPAQTKAQPANQQLLDSVLAGTGNPTAQTVQAMEQLIDLLNQSFQQTPKDQALANRLLLWMKPCLPRFTYIREAIIPRLLHTTTDRHLHMLMMQLDIAAFWLQGKLAMLEFGAAAGEVATAGSEDVVDLIRQCTRIAQHLNERYTPA